MVSSIASGVFRNGRVYTVDVLRSWAEAVAVGNGRVIYVGDDAGLEEFIGPDTEVTDLHGRMMLPGFFDSHVHLASGGHQELDCKLAGIKDPADVLAAIRTYIAKDEPDASGWIRGSGWDSAFIQAPDKRWLDELTPEPRDRRGVRTRHRSPQARRPLRSGVGWCRAQSARRRPTWCCGPTRASQRRTRQHVSSCRARA